MRARRVKLIWGASRVIRGRWFAGLFGFYERAPGDMRSGLAISLRGVLAWGLVLAALAYAAGATALYGVWRGNPYNQLTYADAIWYPLRQPAISEKKGRAFIAQGTELFRAGKFVDAANLFRLGLARCPHDLPARLQLAQFYLMANQRPLAGKVLEEGLRDTYPGRPYLEALCSVLEQAEDRGRIVELTKRYRPQLADDAQRRDQRWLESREFAALLASGRSGEALALAEAIPPGDSAAELQVLALLALKRTAEALDRLERWQAQPGADRRVVVRLRVRALRESGRFDEMERALGELQAMAPAEPAALVYGVVQRSLAGRTENAAEAAENYLFRFGGSVENLLLMAEPLAEIKALPLLQRCATAAAERGYPLQRFHALLVQAHVEHGQWADASALLARVAPPAGRDGQTRVWKEWMERLIAAADSSADSAQLGLVEFLRSRPWPMRFFRTSIDALLRAERLETARDAIAVATRAFPANAWLESAAEDVRLKLAIAPSAPVAGSPLTGRMLVERIFFQRLEELCGVEQWDEVDQLIRDLRDARPAPAWLGSREPDLWLVQVKSCQARGEVAGLVRAARMYLGGEEPRAQRLLETARDFAVRGDRSSGILLVKEVLRWFPHMAAAQRQLAEWEPQPKTKS